MKIIEKRVVNRLISHWNEIRKDNLIPDINLLNIHSPEINNIWNTCVLISVKDQKNMIFQYEYIGSDILDLFADGRQNSSLNGKSKLSYNPISKILGKYRSVNAYKNPRPIIDSGDYELSNGIGIKYRSCLLPFGGELAEHIVIGFTWKMSKFDVID